jgi:hypothetical protein
VGSIGHGEVGIRGIALVVARSKIGEHVGGRHGVESWARELSPCWWSLSRMREDVLPAGQCRQCRPWLRPSARPWRVTNHGQSEALELSLRGRWQNISTLPALHQVGGLLCNEG